MAIGPLCGSLLLGPPVNHRDRPVDGHAKPLAMILFSRDIGAVQFRIVLRCKSAAIFSRPGSFENTSA